MALEQVKTQVLLLHSEQSTLDNLSTGFSDRYTVHCATSGTEALNTLGDTPIHVIISAQKLPGMSGVEALREARKRSPETIGILLAGPGDENLEALVGAKEVFQIVRGGISADDVSKLVDNATQQMRLLALAESANDRAANPDEPQTAEHIVMETSENGSAIISDGTGQVPVLDPKKISAAAASGAQTVDVLVLTKDEEFLATVKESSRGMHNIRYANTLAQAENALAKFKIGVAVVDAAMVGANVEKLTEHLRGKTSRLVSIVAGRRDDGEMLMDLINRGKVYRFLLKPVSPGRARLAVEASVKHHLDAPDSAFKIVGSEKASTVAAKSAPKPAAKPKPVAKPEAKAKAAAKKAPVPAPKPASAEAAPQIEITPSLENDRLASAFDEDNSSFAETMTGIVANIGEKFAGRKKENEDKDEAPVAVAAATDSSGASPFTDPKILGIGAAAVVAVVAVGYFMFSGSDSNTPELVPSQAATATTTPQINTSSEQVPDAPIDNNAIDVDIALANAEAALLDRRSEDAATELATVAEADPNNARLPFLMAQLSQMQLRNHLDTARTAIRDLRLADAASSISGARSLNVADASEIDTVDAELAAAIDQQQVDDVLTLVLQARSAIDTGNFDDADLFLSDASAIDSNNADLAAATLALSDARERVAADARRAEEQRQADARAETDRIAAENQAEADRVAAAERQSELDRQAEIERQAEADRVAAAELQTEIDRQAEIERQAEADLVAAAALAEEQRLAAERQTAIDGQAELERQAQLQRDTELERQAVAVQSVAEEGPPVQSRAAAMGPAIPATSSRQQETVAAMGPAIPATSSRQQETVAVSSLTRTRYVAPKYPRAAERRGQSGWVDVVFTVTADGTTSDIEVRSSDPGTTFVNAATKAIEKWEFMPIFENGIVVEKRAGIRMMFAIE